MIILEMAKFFINTWLILIPDLQEKKKELFG